VRSCRPRGAGSLHSVERNGEASSVTMSGDRGNLSGRTGNGSCIEVHYEALLGKASVELRIGGHFAIKVKPASPSSLLVFPSHRPSRRG